MRVVYVLSVAAIAFAQPSQNDREQKLLERIEQLEQRIALLEAKVGLCQAETKPVASAPTDLESHAKPPDTTVNVTLDGYFSYNSNRPHTGANALRAYDVTDRSFSLNQAGIIIERAPDPASGRRVGARIDLMFGQATETLQGSTANEPRPEVYRHLFQAYGTYVSPLGKGLAVDFGKWASSFGIENNYTKDQFNYSRSYWFNFLPYYHMGVRATYPVTGRLNASYWLVNGLNQTEDFNRHKSQAVLFNFAPSQRLTANLNYYAGREQRALDGPGPGGSSHFVDVYFTWQATDRLTLAGEADYAVSRMEPWSPAQTVTGGAGYVRYRIHPRFSVAGRYARLNDRAGWFSGVNQSLNDGTATATFDLAEGFQMRWEVRRDWSNRRFFTTNDPHLSSRQQTTAIIGLVWWYGGKRGAW